jgi:hypothetical protein
MGICLLFAPVMYLIYTPYANNGASASFMKFLRLGKMGICLLFASVMYSHTLPTQTTAHLLHL